MISQSWKTIWRYANTVSHLCVLYKFRFSQSLKLGNQPKFSSLSDHEECDKEDVNLIPNGFNNKRIIHSKVNDRTKKYESTNHTPRKRKYSVNGKSFTLD